MYVPRYIALRKGRSNCSRVAALRLCVCAAYTLRLPQAHPCRNVQMVSPRGRVVSHFGTDVCPLETPQKMGSHSSWVKLRLNGRGAQQVSPLRKRGDYRMDWKALRAARFDGAFSSSEWAVYASTPSYLPPHRGKRHNCTPPFFVQFMREHILGVSIQKIKMTQNCALVFLENEFRQAYIHAHKCASACACACAMGGYIQLFIHTRVHSTHTCIRAHADKTGRE